MKRFLLAVLLFAAMPAQADQAQIQCPGQNTIEMRWCAAQKLKPSNMALHEQLSLQSLESWNRAKQQVCTEAYAPFMQGSIYVQMIVSCDDRLNRSLLKEFTHLGE